jgi:hypothetical protein
MYCPLIDSMVKHSNLFYLPNNMPMPMGMAWEYLMGCLVALTVKGINKLLITGSEEVFTPRRLNKC